MSDETPDNDSDNDGDNDGDIDVTGLLAAWREGDDRALGVAMPEIYQALRRMARSQLRREGAPHLFETTDLMHQAFIRILGQRDIVWHDRQHFFAVIASMIRRCLVDEARAQLTGKRGRRAVHVPIDQVSDQAFAADTATHSAREIVALHDSLRRLEKIDPKRGAVVMLRMFGGLSIEESATLLVCSQATVKRYWRLAKAWLYRDIKSAL